MFASLTCLPSLSVCVIMLCTENGTTYAFDSVIAYIMSCYVMLCYIMLNYVVVCCVVLCQVMVVCYLLLVMVRFG